MHLRPSCLFLLVSLVSGAASAAVHPPVLSAEVDLVSSPRTISTLPLDVEALARRLCEGGGPSKPVLRSDPRDGVKSKCQITPTLVLSFEVANRGAGLSLSAHRFLSAVTVETSCGFWDATLTLDPTRPQPVTPMVFEAADDPGRGAFAGVLTMDTQLHLANRDSGQTADFALRLGLGLRTLRSADDTGGDDDCIPLSVVESEDLDVKELLAEGCTICPDDPSELTRRGK